jgi:hypothetical protein
MNQFAKCLKEKLAQGHAAPPVAVSTTQAGAAAPASASSAARLSEPPQPSAHAGAAAPPAKPIAGFSLLARVVWNWLTGLFRRQ